MRKVLSVLALLWLALPARAQIEVSRHFGEDVQRRAFETIVRINVDHGNYAVQGSGVCIRSANGKSYILTCAHVLKDVEKAKGTVIEVFTRDSYPNPSKTYRTSGYRYWRNHKTDLALIVAKIDVPSSVKLCRKTTKVPVGTPVLAVGCGAGAPPVCQVGRVKGQDSDKDFVMDRGAIGGRSGGALVSASGLIGILARRSDDGETFAVNCWKIHQFLRSSGHSWLIP
jgi:hypothetical protein